MVTKTDEDRKNREGQDGVQELLDAFARALTAGDGVAIGKMWELPSYVLGDGMARTIEMREEVEEFFGSAKDQYAERGITDTRAEITRLEWLTEKIALVGVRWPYLDEDGTEKGEERSTYALRQGDDGALRICAVVMQGASD